MLSWRVKSFLSKLTGGLRSVPPAVLVEVVRAREVEEPAKDEEANEWRGV